MKDRIKLLMEFEKMTQQDFANFIGISPGALSSIFSGRTKPTLNTVEAIHSKYPEINLDWLMFGKGEMFLNANGSRKTNKSCYNNNPVLPFDDLDVDNFAEQDTKPSPKGNLENVHKEIKYIDKPARKIKEIRVFFDDQTWETFSPKED